MFIIFTVYCFLKEGPRELQGLKDTWQAGEQETGETHQLSLEGQQPTACDKRHKVHKEKYIYFRKWQTLTEKKKTHKNHSEF